MNAKEDYFLKTPIEDSTSIRRQYEELGVEGFYWHHGSEYRNPHEPIIRELLHQTVKRWNPDLTEILDLACGSGEVTMALRELGCQKIDGIDPYTGEAYLARTGQRAESFDFGQIAAGSLSGRKYTLIVCSFAMHLIDESRLPALLSQLGSISDRLLILTPHKRPEIKTEWGWSLEGELLIERVRARLYQFSVFSF
jgi:hypothetical protein